MIVVLKKKSLVLAAICIALAVTAACSIPSILGKKALETKGSTRKLPVYSVAREDKKIAISFDAAWGADKTQGIIDCLTQRGAKATFFLTGFWIEKYPEMVKAVYDAGMEIGNHSDNHLMNTKLASSELEKEISAVNDMIVELTGKRPKFYRCPFGDYNDDVISAVWKQDMIAVQWSIDSLDWKGLSAAELIERIVPKAQSGSIILCHNNSDHILDALPTILDSLTEKGFEFVTMSELVYPDGYYIDSQGTQRKDTDVSADVGEVTATIIQQ